MAITFFGVASTPADNGAQAGPTVTITPPVGMVAGDLVVVAVQYRNTQTDGDHTNTLRVNAEGGQAWSFERQAGTTLVALRGFWCRFNGTWSTNPSFSVNNSLGVPTGTLAETIVMLVFRPTTGSKFWVPDIFPRTATFTAGVTPFTKTITGVTTIAPSTVTIAIWATADDNTWGTLTGTGWIKTGLAAQYRNTTGADQSLTLAYQIKTSAGATNPVSQNQATLGGDAGATYLVSFAEVDLPSGGSGSGLARVQSTAFQAAGSASAHSLVLPSAIGSGHGYVGIVYYESAGLDQTLVSITDNGAQAETATIVQVLTDEGFTHSQAAFFRPDAGGVTTITANFIGLTGIVGIVVHEVSGNMTFDRAIGRFFISQDAFVSATVSPGSITPSVNGCFILGAVNTTNTTPATPFWSPATAWGTERHEISDGISTATLASGDTVQTTAAAIDAAWTASLGRDANVVVIVLKPAPGFADLSVNLTSVGNTLKTARVIVAPTTTKIVVKLARRTTATPGVWPNDLGKVKMTVRVITNGVVTYAFTGQCSGGIRLNKDLTEVTEYRLECFPPVRWTGTELQSIIAEATQAEAEAEVELLAGTVVTTLTAAAT